MKKKIIISGNFYWDKIFNLKNKLLLDQNNKTLSFYERAGGVLNFEKIIESHKNSLIDFTVGSDEIGKKILKQKKTHLSIKKLIGRSNQSFIFIDRTDSTRTAFSIDGVGYDHLPTKNFKSDWYHIAYLDSLKKIKKDYLEELSKKTDNLSCDLCDNMPTESKIKKIKTFLKYFNFLIISDHELKVYFPEKTIKSSILSAKKYVKNIIVHSPKKVWINGSSQIINHYYINNINTLAAGDYFCANFIVKMLEKKHIIDSVMYAQRLTSKNIRELNGT